SRAKAAPPARRWTERRGGGLATGACSQLGIRCADEPLSLSLCHCDACQRRTGAPFGIAAIFAAADVEVSGRSQAYARGSDSGHDVTLHFCSCCGGTVFWLPHRKPGVYAVAVGAFADSDFPAPSRAVYAAHRHAGPPTTGSPWDVGGA